MNKPEPDDLLMRVAEAVRACNACGLSLNQLRYDDLPGIIASAINAKNAKEGAQ